MARDRLAALRAQQLPAVQAVQESFPQQAAPPRRPTLSHRLSFEDSHESFTAYASPSPPPMDSMGAFSNPFVVPGEPSASPPRAPPQATLPTRRPSDPFGTPRAPDQPMSTFDNYSMSSRASSQRGGPTQRKTHAYQSSIAHTTSQQQHTSPPPFTRQNTMGSVRSARSSYSAMSVDSADNTRLVPTLGQHYGLGVSNTVDSSMETFFAELSLVQGETRDFDDALTRIEALHSRELNTVSDSPEAQRVSAELSRVTQEAITLSNSLKKRIQGLERTNGLGRDLSNSEKNVKRTQTAGAKNRFVTAVQRYSSIEAAHRAACRQRLARQYRVVRPSATEEEIRQAVDDPQSGIFQQATLGGRSDQARSALNAVQARQADLLKIEQTITELAQLFSDMAYMVEEQQEAIDDIEEKAIKVEHDMEAARVDLGHAKVSARNARNKRKWCFGIFMVILVIVAIVVVVVLKQQGVFNKSSSTSTVAATDANANEAVPVASSTSSAVDNVVQQIQQSTAAVPAVSTADVTITHSVTATATATVTATVTSTATAFSFGRAAASTSAVARIVAGNGA